MKIEICAQNSFENSENKKKKKKKRKTIQFLVI